MWIVEYQSRLPVEARRWHQWNAYYYPTMAVYWQCYLLSKGLDCQIRFEPNSRRLALREAGQ